ncbi:MAG: pectate lyase [Dysgonamonadaceae bacterium]|nr:pectate lyase [Dysgonamonadaceae bacterium]
MNKIVFLLLYAGVYCSLQAQIPAFPGAEGGGQFTTGGRGGTVYFVTSLADTNTGNTTTREGTLRWCLGRSGTKTIVFRVSGIIHLTSQLNISSHTTLAGQTAPGDGICLADNTARLNGDNIIVRYLRFRMGDVTNVENDAFWGRERQNIIIDHCSMSWSTDECASFYDNTNFTLQWCLLSESLRVSIHGKGTHGYGGIWGGHTASFHHNLFAHHDSRNPRMCGSRYSNRPDLERVDFRNNVIYNWGANSGYAGEGGSYNFINNYYKPGPASSNRTRIFQPNADDGKNAQPSGVWGRFYVDGNYVSSSAMVSNDNWQGITPNPSSKNKDEIKSTVPFEVPAITTHNAVIAYGKVRELVGASLMRDEVDARIIREVTDSTFTYPGSKGSNKGLIDSQADVGGWPVYNSLPAPQDADRDGIPDEWLTQNYPGKKATDFNEEGYTYLEVYLNSLVQHLTDKQLTDALPVGIPSVLPEKIRPAVYYDSSASELRVLSALPVKQTAIYSLQGIRVKKINTPGIYIARIVWENNESHTYKIIVKAP